jgi:glycosyltransferase involved in cell wall biosynthesis
VLFAPGYSAPLRTTAPTVLTVHDVSYFDHPEWFAAREGWRLRTLTRRSVRQARLVLTDSEFSRQRIVHHLTVPPAQMRLIHLGVRAPDRAPSRPSREPMVLFAGSIFDRRHVDWLMESFEQVANRVPGARLEIVGENRTRKPRLDLEAIRRKSPHRGEIALRSYIDETTLADLYSRASVFVFPSEYEGFGFTPLEALAAGIPPVVLDTPVARETCGAAAKYVRQSTGHAQLVDAQVELLTSNAARAAILQHAPATLARFNWGEAARATLAAIEEAAGAP